MIVMAVVVVIFIIAVDAYSSIYATCTWGLIQLLRCLLSLPGNVSWFHRFVDSLEENAWLAWEYEDKKNKNRLCSTNTSTLLSIPTLDINQLNSCLLNTNESPRFCSNQLLQNDSWMQYPLLIRNLWTVNELNHPKRQLSMRGFQTNQTLAGMIIPYYRDSTKAVAEKGTNNSTTAGYNYLSPDASSRLGDILDDITRVGGGSKAKIATQYIVESHPHLIQDIIPPTYSHIIDELFGNVFQPQHLQPTGPFGIFPAWTTVPIFIASSTTNQNARLNQSYSECIHPTDTCIPIRENHHNNNTSLQHAKTDLHCEPIGNIAVQLLGRKRWTLVSPRFSKYLRPTISRHGRAFFFSMLPDTSNLHSIPHYQVITEMGDALWVRENVFVFSFFISFPYVNICIYM